MNRFDVYFNAVMQSNTSSAWLIHKLHKYIYSFQLNPSKCSRIISSENKSIEQAPANKFHLWSNSKFNAENLIPLFIEKKKKQFKPLNCTIAIKFNSNNCIRVERNSTFEWQIDSIINYQLWKKKLIWIRSKWTKYKTEIVFQWFEVCKRESINFFFAFFYLFIRITISKVF